MQGYFLVNFVNVFPFCQFPKSIQVKNVFKLDRTFSYMFGENPVSWLVQFVFNNLYAYLKQEMSQSRDECPKGIGQA